MLVVKSVDFLLKQCRSSYSVILDLVINNGRIIESQQLLAIYPSENLWMNYIRHCANRRIDALIS